MRRTCRIAAVVAVLIATIPASRLVADEILVDLTASAQELGGQEEDLFTLTFSASDPNARIAEAVFDLSECAVPYYWDLEGPDSVSPYEMPSNTCTVEDWYGADNTTALAGTFEAFAPGQQLAFGADIDSDDCSVFTPAGFAGARLFVMLDLSLVDNDVASYYPVTLTFGAGGAASVSGQSLNTVTEPATLGVLTGVLALGAVRRRRRMRRPTAKRT